jgi:hypothetical protein
MIPRKKRRPPDIFARKWIITIPPYGPPIIAGGVIVSFFLPDAMRQMTNIICVIAAFICVASALLVRRELNELRLQVHSILHDIDNLDLLEELDTDDSPNIRIPHSKLKDVNGTNVTRLSGP